MTRLLSTLLGAKEPEFRISFSNLEAAHGMPSHDIRLSSEIVQASKDKLKQLGLDPHDTTSKELYHTLQERLRTDDAHLEKALRTQAATYISAEGDVVAGMVHALQELPYDRSCYALKPSVLKNLLKKQAPKRAMKQLGYRSVESLLKNETWAFVMTAAWLSESAAWRKGFLESYKVLQPKDFEVRQISISHPSGKKWAKLSEEIVGSKRHNLISFKELGAIVLLPLPKDKPAGTTTASFTLALHALNEIRAASTFLQLTQVRGDFGKVVQVVVADEAKLDAHMLDQQVPWELIHRYYSRLKHAFSEDLFEPYLHFEDLNWHAVEKALSHIEPKLAFWHDSAHLGTVHNAQAVSFNILDAALNLCNDLPFEKRLLHYGRNALQHEIMLRYLNPEAVEEAVKTTMQPQFAEEKVLV